MKDVYLSVKNVEYHVVIGKLPIHWQWPAVQSLRYLNNLIFLSD